VAQASVQDETHLLERLRAGEEEAFAELVDSCHTTMLAVAQTHVRSRAVAEEVVQEGWMGVIRGLDGFEGRSSLKTWILRIVVNTAKTRSVREARSVPFASLGCDEPAVDRDRFRGPDDRYPGGWRVFPADWQRLPDDTLHQREALDVIVSTIASLPPAQRAVMRMRDIEGYTAEEVCAALDLTQGNQRALLHRGRSLVRSALEQHLP
jgi:RNA polymerase sigma-70 factor (ECF subfamily)